MEVFEKEFGKPMKAAQVAAMTGVDVKTVRQYFSDFGGIPVGERRILFFERRLMDALSKHKTKSEKVPVGGTGTNKREKKTEVMPDKKGGGKLGRGAKTRKFTRDAFNVLA